MQMLEFSGGESKTFKERRDGCLANVCSGTIYYVIRNAMSVVVKNGNTDLPFGMELGNGGTYSINQSWRRVDNTESILTGLSSEIYTLAVYVEAPGSTKSFSDCDETFQAEARTASFTVSSMVPVSWLSFSATAAGNGVNLAWATATETNNAYLELERSADARQWQAITRINGGGVRAGRTDYAYREAAPLTGDAYYRRRQVDYDGTYDYSPIRSVRHAGGGDDALRVFPNPFNDELRGELTSNTDLQELPLYDGVSRLLHRLPTAESAGRLWLSHEPAGLYWLVAYAADSTSRGRDLLTKSR